MKKNCFRQIIKETIWLSQKEEIKKKQTISWRWRFQIKCNGVLKFNPFFFWQKTIKTSTSFCMMVKMGLKLKLKTKKKQLKSTRSITWHWHRCHPKLVETYSSGKRLHPLLRRHYFLAFLMRSVTDCEVPTLSYYERDHPTRYACSSAWLWKVESLLC